MNNFGSQIVVLNDFLTTSLPEQDLYFIKQFSINSVLVNCLRVHMCAGFEEHMQQKKYHKNVDSFIVSDQLYY